MHIFSFLKSTRGAIKPLNALIISGVAGAGFFYVANTAADKHIEAKRVIRSVSGISQTDPRAGMSRRGDMLTSINVRDGRNQLATAEERAAMKGNGALDRYAANQRALDAMDGALTRAAQFSGSDPGLNTGNRNAVQTPVQLAVGNPNANAGAAVAQGAISSANGSSAQGPARLSNASITRSSGNSFGGTSGAVSGGISVSAGSERQRLSGAMPGGNNIVSQRGLDGALAGGRNTASFGQNRNGRLGRARNGKGERDELKDIVKRSAEAAGNANASANEGGRAFLANAVNSGGISVDGGEDMTRGASSEDLASPTNHKLKAVGNKLDDIEKEQEKRNAQHRALIWQLVTTALGSIGAMVVASRILSKMKKSPDGYSKLAYWAIAAAFMASVTAANAWLFFRAKKFISDYGAYGGTTVAIIAEIVAPLMVAGMLQTILSPDWKDFIKTLWGKIKQRFDPVNLLTSTSTDAINKL